MTLQEGETPGAVTTLGVSSRIEAKPHWVVRLVRPCSAGDGVVTLTAGEALSAERFFVRSYGGRRIVKFVPCAGAASRMFRSLAWAWHEPIENKGLFPAGARDGAVEACDLKTLMEHLENFAFYEPLKEAMESRGLDLEALRSTGEYAPIVRSLLGPEGLGYAQLPKALLPYHRYSCGVRTALEEHVREAQGYARDHGDTVAVHFAVSPGHLEAVKRHFDGVEARLAPLGVRFELALSVQSPDTDTIATDLDGNAILDEEGKPVRKPSGHGALLANLNSLEADAVFIKTVDNVLPESLQRVVCFWKRVLGGLFFQLEGRVHSALRTLSAGPPEPEIIAEIHRFASLELSIEFPDDFERLSALEKTKTLFHKLNRPLRVCGVVRSEGEPGGAPFWVDNGDGTASLRLVEGQEVDHTSEGQEGIWKSASYFNPVDVVCSVRDYQGRTFHLPDYADARASFRTVRWHGRKPILIRERPGLWNGAMAFWNTVFVEVPRITVHPVKSILDLLSWQHLA